MTTVVFAGDIEMKINGATDAVTIDKADGSEAMRVTADGNVGIGTTNPKELLQLKGLRGAIGLTDIDQFTDANDWMYINPVQDDLRIGFHDTSASINRDTIIIKGNGNVGIGTTSPTEKLDVVGNIVYTGTITDISDARLKEEITPLENSLEKLLSLNGVSFMMKDRKLSENREYGVLAQDVEKVFPELIQNFNHSDGKEYMSVNYTGLIGPMIEAIKELRSEKDDEISELREMNMLLKTEICIINPSSKICK